MKILPDYRYNHTIVNFFAQYRENSPFLAERVVLKRENGFLSVAVSCGTCFAVKTCDGLYHFIFSIDRVGIPFGFQPHKRSIHRGPFPESLVVKLYSEIDLIHLSIEAQCVTTLLPLGDCHTIC